MDITKEQFEFLSNKYQNCIQDMLCQNMPFFKFRQQPTWGFIFDERIAICGKADYKINTVMLNLASIDFSFENNQQLMIEQFALHEFRHLYQYGEIKKYQAGDYDGIESVETLERWAYEREHYISPQQKDLVNKYYEQDLEFDAFTFAYAAMKFKYRHLPNYIKMPEYYKGKFETIVEKWCNNFSEQFYFY